MDGIFLTRAELEALEDAEGVLVQSGKYTGMVGGKHSPAVDAIIGDLAAEGKGKKTYHDFETRKKMLESVRYVDLVIPENAWDQKIGDVQKYEIDAVVMGGDWEGDPRFEVLTDYCDVIYLDRTEGISTTKIKRDLGVNA